MRLVSFQCTFRGVALDFRWQKSSHQGKLSRQKKLRSVRQAGGSLPLLSPEIPREPLWPIEERREGLCRSGGGRSRPHPIASVAKQSLLLGGLSVARLPWSRAEVPAASAYSPSARSRDDGRHVVASPALLALLLGQAANFVRSLTAYRVPIKVAVVTSIIFSESGGGIRVTVVKAWPPWKAR